jgi:hypothetical protein
MEMRTKRVQPTVQDKEQCERREATSTHHSNKRQSGVFRFSPSFSERRGNVDVSVNVSQRRRSHVSQRQRVVVRPCISSRPLGQDTGHVNTRRHKDRYIWKYEENKARLSRGYEQPPLSLQVSYRKQQCAQTKTKHKVLTHTYGYLHRLVVRRL